MWVSRLIRNDTIVSNHIVGSDMFSKFFEWQELIWLHHFVSYEYFRIMIWHGLSFEHFKNLDNRVFWTFWEMTCSFRSILSSNLGLNSFEPCFSKFLIFLRPWSCDTRIIRYSQNILSSCLKIVSKHVFNKLGIQCTTIPQTFTFVWIRKHARRHPGMYKS